MTKKKSTQPPVKPYRGWLLSNYGHPWTVVNRREQAKQYAEDHTGEPWEQCQKYCRITRVEVKPV
jgi:hypothetical protein